MAMLLHLYSFFVVVTGMSALHAAAPRGSARIKRRNATNFLDPTELRDAKNLWPEAVNALTLWSARGGARFAVIGVTAS